MPNLNRVMLMGNLTRDPELRYTPNNTAVANIGLAINRTWRNQQGEKQEDTTFVDCEAWGRTAEVLNQYLRKGRPVYVEGRLRLDQWQDKEGNNRSKLKVVVETFQFIDSRGGGDDEGGGGPPAGQQSNSHRNDRRDSGPSEPPPSRQASYSSAPADEPHHPVQEEDIPF